MARGDSISKTHIYETPFFQHLMVLVILATLVVGILALVNVYQLKKALIPKTTSHTEMKGYVGTAPLNIVQINSNNLANLQSQISGLDASYIGNFIVQYTDRIVVYDYENDKLRGAVSLQQQTPQVPSDFFAKLNKHAELQGLQNEQPIGGQLDEASLSTLMQQFPEVYANAKPGDFLLRYKTRLVIYDYTQDKMVNAVNLG